MTAGQRRILWLVCFGMACIFWYEASGQPLVWEANAPATPLAGTEARDFYWAHIGYGAFFVVCGALLTLVVKSSKERTPYSWGDTIALALGIGTLIGTAIRSAMQAGLW